VSQRKWTGSLANGSVGHSHDNALAETINGLYKAEVIWRRGPWRNVEAVELAALKWVDWFNHRRLVERIGNIPPAEAEAEAEAGYYAQIEEPAMAALLKQNGLRQTRGDSVLGMIELRSAFALRSCLSSQGADNEKSVPGVSQGVANALRGVRSPANGAVTRANAKTCQGPRQAP
jgi:hypothetical protein